MDVITLTLLAISLILFFGFFAEFIFRKLSIPDVLFLIVLGFTLGPAGLNYVMPEDLIQIAPVFTTFTLLFLLFDGAFNIHLSSLIREFSKSLYLTLFNFFISTIVVTAVMKVSGFSFLISLLTGFMLGGVSSSFVIPILKQINVGEKIYSLLTLESALTDVFCIVFSLTVIEIFKLGGFGFRETLTQIASLFAVAGLIGLIGGIVWIILILRVFKEHNYVMAIAYLILIYVVTEFLNGNGAIAALFFGLILKNSKQLSSIIKGILTNKAKEKKKALKGELGVSVTTPSEEYFYHQISFLLKTFFFVYIGVLIDLSDWKALVIGGVISLLLMGSRMASLLLTKAMNPINKDLINSIFARGLAAAAIAQLAVQAGIPYADFIGKVTYVVITGTIILSSIKIFIVEHKMMMALLEVKK
ncbi:MAG: cation:proton antiporter [Nanoarchaeota archaeon]|nr:cation:proton antiporter [Nanoarchaeota archaeon]MBU1632367.1 cation:proton antiporter [Nanoarchaeota archaeon]MBU1875825.1 cation:proton antiporter [Nanoarchaeota archaeon]